jgi:hypothetical protein
MQSTQNYLTAPTGETGIIDSMDKSLSLAIYTAGDLTFITFKPLQIEFAQQPRRLWVPIVIISK